ncbi:MAG: NUDIX hydrolase [Mycobacteriales bacterium]
MDPLDPVAPGPADERGTPALPVRLAARVLVLDPDDRVLLLRYDDAPPNGRHWATPGGGLEADEDYATAAVRELWEETGWADMSLDGEIGAAEVTMEYDGRLVAQRERLYLARTDHPFRQLADVAAMHAADRIAAWRWWTLAELISTSEVVWPAGLAGLIATVVRPT